MSAAVTVLAVAACRDAFFFDPAGLDPAGLAVRWAGAASGPPEAYDQADRVRLQLFPTAGGSAVVDEIVDFAPASGETSVTLPVELEEEEASFRLDVEVRMGSSPLFTGSSNVVLRAGETSTADVDLEPVPAGLEIPDSYATLTAYGDSVFLGGALVFATGDTIPDRTPDWSTRDPGVVTVVQRPDGRWYAVALADGTARVDASLDAFQANGTVEVRAEVETVAVTPGNPTIEVDAQIQLTATPRDRRGNPIVGRSATWTSATPSVASVSSTGLVRGESPGDADIEADVEGVTGSTTVTVRSRLPVVETRDATDIGGGSALLHGAVNPRGFATTAWFEWDTDPGLGKPYTTDPQAVGAGEADVPVQAGLTELSPSTTYYFRVAASNEAGLARGDILSFRTLDVPQAPSGLTLVIDGGVYVRWTDNSANETSFEVERAVGSGAAGGPAAQAGAFERIATLGPGAEEYYDESPPIGMLTYRVRACGDGGCSDYSPEQSISYVLPPVVSTSSAASVGTNVAILQGTVDTQGSATQAWFQYGTDPDLQSPASTSHINLGSTPGPRTFSSTVGGLAEGTVFYFRIVASNEAGTEMGSIRSFQTARTPQAPSSLIWDYDEVGLIFQWKDNSDNETYFEIQREYVSAGSPPREDGGPQPVYQSIGTVPANTTTFYDTPPMGEWNYRVRACSDLACSAWSNVVTLYYGGTYLRDGGEAAATATAGVGPETEAAPREPERASALPAADLEPSWPEPVSGPRT